MPTMTDKDHERIDAERGRLFLEKLIALSKSDQSRVAVGSVKLFSDTSKKVQVGAAFAKGATSPGAGVVAISALGIRQAMTMAGMNSEKEMMKCVEATVSLGTTFIVVGALASTGFGLPAATLIVISVALDSYKIGSNCFVKKDGSVDFVLKL